MKRRRARRNPTMREYGALIATTVVTTGVAVLVTYYVTKKLEESNKEKEAQRRGIMPGSELPYFEEVPRGGDWA
jgi:hypothetical protein